MRGDRGVPVRVKYRKVGKIRWISHRDVARALERSFPLLESALAERGGNGHGDGAPTTPMAPPQPAAPSSLDALLGGGMGAAGAEAFDDEADGGVDSAGNVEAGFDGGPDERPPLD